MGYRQKKDVIKSIVLRKYNDRKFYDAYIGYDPITKKQRRLQNVDLKELKNDIEEFYVSLKDNGVLGVTLKPYELVDARKAYNILYNSDLKMTLEDIVKEYISPNNSFISTKTLGDAYEEYYASFTNEHSLHKKAIASRVGRWVIAFGDGKLVSDVQASDVTQWLTDNYSTSNKTYNNYLTYIKSFLSWCTKKERRYLKENPLEDTAQKTIAYKEPEYLSSEKTKQFFALLENQKDKHPEYLIYAILSFFCGVRREEIIRIATVEDSATVNLEDETIRIAKPKGWTKGICPRAFRIMPNALLWLKSVDFDKVHKICDSTTRFMYDLARRNGIEIPKNAGRHTFITMHVAKYGDPSKTEAMVGTSKKMRVSNYCGLASHKEGNAYFDIIPSTSLS